MTHILKDQSQPLQSQESISFSNTRAYEWRPVNVKPQNNQIARINSCQTDQHKYNCHKVKQMVFQSTQEGHKPNSACQSYSKNTGKGLSQLKSGRPQGSQIVCQIDKTYLMRNFPLSYFENVDMLFRIKGKSKKTNTKSCNNLHRKTKNQEQNQRKSKEERPQDFRSEKSKCVPSEKENIQTIKWFVQSSCRKQQKIQANKQLFNRKYKQIQSITQPNNKSRQMQREPIKTNMEDKAGRFINNKRFSHSNKLEVSSYGSDSRDTLHPPRYYSRNIKKPPLLRKQTRNEHEQFYRVATSPTTPKLNVEKSQKKLNKKRNICTTSTKGNIFSKKRGFIEPESQTLNELQLSLLNSNSIKIPISVRYSQSDDHKNSKKGFQTRQKKSETHFKNNAPKRQLNNIVQFSRQEDIPLQNKAIEDNEDAKTVKIGCQSEQVEVLEPIESMKVDVNAFKKSNKDKGLKKNDVIKASNPIIQIKTQKFKGTKLSNQNRQVSSAQEKRVNQAIAGDKHIRKLVATTQACKQDEIKEQEPRKETVKKIQKDIKGQENLSVVVSEIQPCIFPESNNSTESLEQNKNKKSKSIYEDFIEEKETQSLTIQEKPQKKNQQLSQTLGMQICRIQIRNNIIDEENSQVQQTQIVETSKQSSGTPLVTVNNVNAANYMPKSWIKDALTQSQEEETQKHIRDSIAPKKVNNPHVFSSLQASLNNKLQTIQNKINTVSSNNKQTSFCSEEIDNFCNAIIQLEKKIQIGQEQFNEIQRILDTESEAYNDTIAKRLNQMKKISSEPIQNKDTPELNQKQSLKSIEKPIMAYTDSAQYINSIQNIKHQPQGQCQNFGSKASIFSRDSDCKAPSTDKRPRRHNTIAQNADEDLLQSNVERKVRFDSRPKANEAEKSSSDPGDGMLDSSCIEEGISEEKKTQSHYNEHHELMESAIFIDLENKIADPKIVKTKKSSKAKESNPSCLDMNSEEQAQIQKYLNNQDKVVEAKAQNSKKNIKGVKSQWPDSDLKNSSKLKSSDISKMIVVNQRGSQVMLESIAYENGQENMTHMNRSRSMKTINLKQSKKLKNQNELIDKDMLLKESRKLTQSISKLNNKTQKQQLMESICMQIQKTQQKVIPEEKNIPTKKEEDVNDKERNQKTVKVSAFANLQMKIQPKSQSFKQQLPPNNESKLSRIQLHKAYDINIFNSCHQNYPLDEGKLLYSKKAEKIINPIRQEDILEAKLDEILLRSSEVDRMYNKFIDEIIDKDIKRNPKYNKLMMTQIQQIKQVQEKQEVKTEQRSKIVKKSVKQVKCAIEVEYFDMDESLLQKKIEDDANDIPKRQMDSKIKQVQEADESLQTDNIKIEDKKDEQLEVGWDSHPQEPAKKMSINKADAMMNTVDCLELSEKRICDPIKLADISQYCQNYSFQVKKLPKSTYELNEKCWSIVSKILKFVIGGNGYFKRLIDSDSVWLYTDKKKHTFQRYQKSSNNEGESHIIREALRLYLGNYVHKNDQIDNSEEYIVKYYLELLIGMPILMVKQSCFNKLDNLYRHSSIFGFAYGKRHVWRIVGIVENKKREKCVKLQKLNNKDAIELGWQKFQEEFKCAFISCFNAQYFNRGVQLPQKKEGKGGILTLKLTIEKEEANSKIHCMLGCDFGKTKQKGGKMIVYVKVKSEEKQEQFKYMGSGDLTLISMKLKPGEYMIVLDVEGGESGGQLMMGCSSGNTSLQLEGGWRNKEDMRI